MTFGEQVVLFFKMLGVVVPILIIGLVVVFVMSIPIMIRNNRLKKAGILDTDKMTGIEFENWLKFRFQELGYKVKTTPRTGDGGADLILAAPNGTRKAVQAKKSSKQNIGVKAVEEVMRGQKVHDCDEAMVVTNQYFTDQAKRDAQKCNVKLMNRDDLLQMCEEINKQKAKSQAKKAV